MLANLVKIDILGYLKCKVWLFLNNLTTKYNCSVIFVLPKTNYEKRKVEKVMVNNSTNIIVQNIYFMSSAFKKKSTRDFMKD
jgi:hypothetical protein